MIRRRALTALSALALSVGTAAAQTAASPERRAGVGGYAQLQYERVDREDGDARDRVFVRRLLLTLNAEVAREWFAVAQFDFGPAASSGSRVIVKDTYLQYRGWRDSGVLLTIGNQKTPFSRSILMASTRRGLVERPFTGDKAFGGPGRAISIRSDGAAQRGKVRWSTALASTLHAPDADEIRIDGLPEASSTWNEGAMLTGRFELHPLGEVPLEHGDFNRGALKLVVGAAAYAWHNDGDRNLHTVANRSVNDSVADVDDVRGFEVSGAVRGHGVSVEAALTRISAEALDREFSGGLFRAGDAHLRAGSVEAGCMLLRRRLEAVAAYDALTSPTFAAAWRRASAGVNWYVSGHDLKFQVMHRRSTNDRGIAGARADATYLQAQIAF